MRIQAGFPGVFNTRVLKLALCAMRTFILMVINVWKCLLKLLDVDFMIVRHLVGNVNRSTFYQGVLVNWLSRVTVKLTSAPMSARLAKPIMGSKNKMESQDAC